MTSMDCGPPQCDDAVAETGVGAVIMHIQGAPRVHLPHPHYHSVMGEIGQFLHESVLACEAGGIGGERIAIDPGPSFGKAVDHDLQLMQAYGELRGFPAAERAGSFSERLHWHCSQRTRARPSPRGFSCARRLCDHAGCRHDPNARRGGHEPSDFNPQRRGGRGIAMSGERIREMEPDLVAQIKAGEVIERPASVAKELLENALDAGAGRIRVEIAEGGTQLIRVVDDGEGIGADQIALAFQEHTSSKLHTAGALGRIQTLGFRGEALHAIASVARVEAVSGARGSSVAAAP